MHGNVRRSELLGDACLHRVRQSVGLSHGALPIHDDRELGEEQSRGRKARPDLPDFPDPRDRPHDRSDLVGVDGPLIDEYRNRPLEDPVAADRDDHGHDDRQWRIELAESDGGEEHRCEREKRDVGVAARVGSVGQKECAAQLAAATPLVPHDEDVDDHRRRQQADLEQFRGPRLLLSQKLLYAFPQQLEAGNRKKPDDCQRADRFELVVTVGMILIRRTSGEGDERHADDVVQRIERRLQRGPEHRKRSGSPADDDLHGDDYQVQREDDAEGASHSRGMRGPRGRGGSASFRFRDHDGILCPGTTACQSRYGISIVPELPEVEQAARIVRRAVAGRMLARVALLHPSLRRKLSPKRLKTLPGAVIARVSRRGKHQLLELEDGRTIHVHFRMAGDWDIGRVDDPIPTRARATLEFTDGTRVSLVDPRALSTMTLHAVGESPLPELGPEPSDPALTPASLMAALARRKGPVKPVLLDQRIIAGVGNIYASEALWRARISPRAVASALTPDRLQILLVELRQVLGPAARLPGRYREARGSRRISVYGRAGKPCRRCSGPIERIVQAGRSTFFCPHCQPS